MATSRKFNVQFRRKREGKTDYKQRLHLLKSEKPRLIIRRSLLNIIAQVAQYDADGDKVALTVHSNDLKKFGLSVVNGNVPTAYLTGLLLGKRAKEAKITTAVVDIGLQKLSHESRLFAVIKGVVDAGVDVHASDKHFPSDDRLNGVHIEEYAKKLQSDKEAYEKQFKAYLNSKIDPTTISQTFAKVKEAVLK